MPAKLYVGTYAKYNSGSIQGAWMDLEAYTDRETFLEACKTLHRDETDPELMFQDFEGFPRGFYSESSAPPDELWEWLGLDEHEQELLAVYQGHIDQAGTIETARESFQGKYDSPSDWAENFLEDTGALQEVGDTLRNYIDFEAYARDAGFNGMAFIRHAGDVWVFNPC